MVSLPTNPRQPVTSVKSWGTLPDGREVHAYSLTNASGTTVQILTYGGIVASLEIPDRNGEFANVVLGFDHLAPYLERHPYFGTITGRLAGRTTNATFTLDGTTVQLAANQAPNHLHGGEFGLDRRLWQATRSADDPLELRLTYTSPDGEEGYPGTVQFETIYRLTETNALEIEFRAESDRPTPVNLTHHGYFNLAGESSGDALDHWIQIHCDQIFTVNPDFSLTGKCIPVDGQPGDFRTPTLLRDVIGDLFDQHGDAYSLPTDGTALVEAAKLFHPKSGRCLTVSTDQPCVQFYTGVDLKIYPQFAGLCLECQGFANGANDASHGDLIVAPGKPRRQRTVYTFSIETPATSEPKLSNT